MSDNDSDTQILTAEYRDGRLQIVSAVNGEGASKEIPAAEAHRYIQVLDPEQGVVNLDSLNLTLVRCDGDEGDSSYRLVTSDECEGDGNTDVNCMLQDDADDEVSYVVVEGDEDQLIILENEPSINAENHPQSDNSDQHMYIDIEIPPIHGNDYEQHCHGNVDLNDQIDQQGQQENEITVTPYKVTPYKVTPYKVTPYKVTPEELIQRAKIVQQRLLEQQRNRLGNIRSRPKKRGNKRHITSPQDILLASPGFKLFLYSCKMCSYKCNAQKELTKHRNTAHLNKVRVSNRAMGIFQCAKCPYRAGLPQQLNSHMEERHHNNKMTITKILTLDSQEVFDADVLVCGACGFECTTSGAFRDHITKHHM